MMLYIKKDFVVKKNIILSLFFLNAILLSNMCIALFGTDRPKLYIRNLSSKPITYIVKRNSGSEPKIIGTVGTGGATNEIGHAYYPNSTNPSSAIISLFLVKPEFTGQITTNIDPKNLIDITKIADQIGAQAKENKQGYQFNVMSAVIVIPAVPVSPSTIQTKWCNIERGTCG
jgi:hypothetical protein